MAWLLIPAYLIIGLLCARFIHDADDDDDLFDLIPVIVWPIIVAILAICAVLEGLHWLIRTPLPNRRRKRALKREEAQARIDELEQEIERLAKQQDGDA